MANAVANMPEMSTNALIAALEALLLCDDAGDEAALSAHVGEDRQGAGGAGARNGSHETDEVALIVEGRCAVVALAGPCLAQMQVITAAPTPRGRSAPLDASISLTFDRPVDPKTVTDRTFWAFARRSGRVRGWVPFSAAPRTGPGDPHR